MDYLGTKVTLIRICNAVNNAIIILDVPTPKSRKTYLYARTFLRRKGLLPTTPPKTKENECDICGSFHITPSALRRHKRQQHSVSVGQRKHFLCMGLQKTFNYRLLKLEK
jgi:hypothetical protein